MIILLAVLLIAVLAYAAVERSLDRWDAGNLVGPEDEE